MSDRNNEIFIIDSNVLITPYKSYYSFEIAPGFWETMADQMVLKNIVILDKVFDEISTKDDPLSQWIKNINGLEQISYRDSEIISNYSKIMNFIGTSSLYSPIALNTWAQGDKADPWIISAAMAHNYTAVTFEISNQSLNVNQPAKNAKIPDVCRHFNVKCKDLFYMMHKLSIRL
jgi:hypothetical protein